jgi:hypothetical protein
LKKGYFDSSVRKKAGLRRNAFIFVICFLISSLIWILIKLSRNYTQTFQYVIEYKGLPKDKLVANNADSIYTIILQEKGYRVLLHNLSSKDLKLSIDVSNKLHSEKNASNSYYLLTSEVVPQLNNLLAPVSTVVGVSPDTVWFSFDKIREKMVHVVPVVDLSFEKQFNLNRNIIVYPESVVVKGPRKFVDTLKNIYTISRSFKKLNSSKMVTMKFAEMYKNFKISSVPDYVKVYIPVEKYTESSVDVPVIVENAPSGYRIKTLPEKVQITFLVGLQDYKNVKPEMFTVTAKYNESKELTMKAELTKQPDFVKVSKISPEKVEFILF